MMGFRFGHDRYRGRIERSQQRLATARRFEEPDQVPIELALGGSFYAWMLGFDIAEYYESRELALEVQLKGQQWAWENLTDDRTGFALYLDIGPAFEGLLFGAEIVRPAGTSPWTRHVIHSPAGVEKLVVPDPRTNPGVQWILRELEAARELARRHGIEVPVAGHFGMHPPLSAACALAGPELIYSWMYEEPDLVRQLFGKLLETYFQVKDYEDEVIHGGRRRTYVGLSDDHSAFVSEAMYRRMVMPYNLAIYDRYGKHGRSLHADGPNDHLFALYADQMKLTEMDIGGFSDIAVAKRAMAGKTVIWGGLNCKDLYGEFERARPVVERAITIGAPGGGFILAIGGEAYAGVNPDTLAKTVEYAQHISRKPTRSQ
jgi:uroporphyrinogen-III decarboxylase